MKTNLPSLKISLLPIGFLIISLLTLICMGNSDLIGDLSPAILLSSAVVCMLLGWRFIRSDHKRFISGIKLSASQILPAVPILALIGLLSTTWMMGGIVPAFIHYGLQMMNPTFFLVTVCAVCGGISIFTGSSWTTIATVGVAFMGIGEVMGYSAPWIAGAVISGAYFGDKVSPLSDTTVVASSSCGVDLFTHIRFMMRTTIPSLLIAFLVFFVEGLMRQDSLSASEESRILTTLQQEFVVTPWTMIVPLVTLVMIALRINTVVTLTVSMLLGLVSMVVFQPQLGFGLSSLSDLWSGVEFHTSDEEFNNLVSTSGLKGMMSTIYLVLSAMIFGGVMIGSGMLTTISRSVSSRLRGRKGMIGATVASGIMLNGFTADQYISIIVGANMYRDVYSRNGLPAKMLSRTIEDSTSVTSVLIPWNSCGLTQSAVLGVPTLAYLPYCVFNYLSPLMSFMVSSGVLRVGRQIFPGVMRKIGRTA